MNLTEALRKFIAGDVLDDEATRAAMSSDMSLFFVRQTTVVFPKNVQDIKGLVRFVSAHKEEYPNLSIAPRAAGTCMSGGPLTESIVLEFTRYFNPQPVVDPDAKIATAEPGVFYRDFEKETLKYNLLLPSYPASRELAAIGGLVNNNAGGEKSLKYGKTE